MTRRRGPRARTNQGPAKKTVVSAVDEKERYAQAGEMLRHYLSWREKLFGGYLAVVAGLAVAFKQPNDPEEFRSAIAIVGVVVTIVFWLLERRNRALFYECVDAAAELEPETAPGPLRKLAALDGTLLAPTHSAVLSCFYALAIVGLIAVAIHSWPR